MSEHVIPLLSKCYQPIAPRLHATFFPVVCRRQQAFSFCLLSVMENGRFQSFFITFLPSHINRPHYLHCNWVFIIIIKIGVLLHPFSPWVQLFTKNSRNCDNHSHTLMDINLRFRNGMITQSGVFSLNAESKASKTFLLCVAPCEYSRPTSTYVAILRGPLQQLRGRKSASRANAERG